MGRSRAGGISADRGVTSEAMCKTLRTLRQHFPASLTSGGQNCYWALISITSEGVTVVLWTFVWNSGRILFHTKCGITGRGDVMESQVAILFGLAVIAVPIALWRLWQLDGAPTPNHYRLRTRQGSSVLARLNSLPAPAADQGRAIQASQLAASHSVPVSQVE